MIGCTEGGAKQKQGMALIGRVGIDLGNEAAIQVQTVADLGVEAPGEGRAHANERIEGPHVIEDVDRHSQGYKGTDGKRIEVEGIGQAGGEGGAKILAIGDGGEEQAAELATQGPVIVQENG